MQVNKRNILFWVLQFVGWFVIDSLSFINDNVLSTKYLTYSFFAYSLIGILITSIYRWYLKRYVTIDLYGKKDIAHLLLAFIICAVIFLGSFYLIEEVYEAFWERTASEVEYLMKFSNIVYAIFSSFAIVLGWTSLYYGIKMYIQRNKHHAEELELSATLREAQLNTLKGQVNPHFMFNSLNNIRGLMLEDVSKSREMITKLSEMLEYSLEKNTEDSIPLAEELEMVKNYIALSKIQMEDRLEYIEDIDQKSLNIPIPPMIIQLLIENAAKHGIANLKNGGTITLSTKNENDELMICVSNTGTLSIAKNSTQLGLKNIRQRLRLLYGNKTYFSLKEIENEVVATIKIPLS